MLIMTEITRCSLSDLHFDSENPRFPSNLIGRKDDATIIEYLLSDEGLLALMASIAQNNYATAEPLLVIPKNDTDNECIVVEGNRRLAALKLLSNPSLAKVRKTSVAEIVDAALFKPKEIPAIKYAKRDEIIDYLGYRHITGIKEWDSMAKARYLKQLYERYKIENGLSIFKVLAKMIGSRTDYVVKLLTALSVTDYANEKAYFGLPGLKEEKIDFSLVTTALSYSYISDFIVLQDTEIPIVKNLNEDNVKDLFSWMFVKNEQHITRLGESRNISKLNDIVHSPDALEKFRSGAVSLDEALLYTDEPNKRFFNFIINAKDSLKSAKFSLEQISSPDDDLFDALKEISLLCQTITGALERRFPKDLMQEDTLDKFSPSDIGKLKKLLESVDRQ
jgi:hypothetical protein